MLIDMKGIRKSYRSGEVETPVLHGIDLSVGAGEYVALMGPSGSGKSTLMNILGLLDRADDGRFVLDGQDVIQQTTSQHSGHQDTASHEHHATDALGRCTVGR